MQFNIYVPEAKKSLLELLDKVSALTGRSKSELVIEALEKYLADAALPPLGRFAIGISREIKRADLYAKRLERA
ncbi:ribbon-helix-helix protein, CopG family [Ammonifex thiophilus]|uniref:ribbon-helix-helix protein, CopG family n=1 Tax=Ammonifex thiophilus TaxID=444093 RepID=UPI0014029893|nr:ribbon-helix-helix protein, CopG family [Ammonifex thiophilus]